MGSTRGAPAAFSKFLALLAAFRRVVVLICTAFLAPRSTTERRSDEIAFAKREQRPASDYLVLRGQGEIDWCRGRFCAQDFWVSNS